MTATRFTQLPMLWVTGDTRDRIMYDSCWYAAGQVPGGWVGVYAHGHGHQVGSEVSAAAQRAQHTRGAAGVARPLSLRPLSTHSGGGNLKTWCMMRCSDSTVWSAPVEGIVKRPAF
jgi:hypothetical protein